MAQRKQFILASVQFSSLGVWQVLTAQRITTENAKAKRKSGPSLTASGFRIEASIRMKLILFQC